MIVSEKWDFVQRRSADLAVFEKGGETHPDQPSLSIVIDNVTIKNLCDRVAMTMSGYSSSPSKILHELPYVRCVAHMLGSLDRGSTIMLYFMRIYLISGLTC